jgi:hypothetical protein
MVECFLFSSRKRKDVMIGDGKSVKKRREIRIK